MHKLIYIAIAILTLLPIPARAEWTAQHVRWMKAIGEQGYLEVCYGVDIVPNRGFILAGRRSPDAAGAKSNAFFVRTDDDGKVKWQSEIDPYPNFKSHSRLLDVVAADDGGFVAAGWVESPDYGDEGYLVKIDAAGRLQWHYIYGNVNMGGGDEDDGFEAIAKTSDGGYIMAGATEALAERGWTDAWLVKVEANGQLQWSRVYGGDGLEYAYDVIQTSDGGYAFVGSTNSFAYETRTFIQKTLSNGDQQWLQVYDANGAEDDGTQEGRAIRQTADGGYLVAGWFAAGSDPGFPFTLKLDGDGDRLWMRASDLGTGYDVYSAMTLTEDGGFLAAGRTNSVGEGDYDALVVKAASAGYTQWWEAVGGGDYDAAYAVQSIEGGGVIVCGKTVGMQWPAGTDMLLVRLDTALPPSLKYRLYAPRVVR
ncbi:MAG: hypothetical protein GXP42_17000 [Chloroflexi bacterium]|nr:hypothetical protein [Chloroflexota bacterium]